MGMKTNMLENKSFKPDAPVAHFRYYIIDDNAVVFGTNDYNVANYATWIGKLTVIDVVNNVSPFQDNQEWQLVTNYENRDSFYKEHFIDGEED